MNIFGKILVWVIVVAAGADLVLSARLLQIRNSWSKVVETIDRQNKQNELELAIKHRELKDVELQYERAVSTSDHFWNNVSAHKDRDSDTLIVGIGQNQGMGVQRPLINAFRMNADGSSRWVGEFRVDPGQINPDSVTMIPTWNLREGESAKWTDDDKWRFRASIPSDYSSELTKLYSKLELADDKVEKEQRLFAGKQKQLEAAKRDRDGNDALLLGDANTGAIGLIENLKLAEKNRNAALEELDHIRRQIKSLNDRIAGTHTKNRKLMKSLPD